MRVITRRALIVLVLLAAVVAIVYLAGYLIMVKMPGKSYSGVLPPLTSNEMSLREELMRDVEKLAVGIGERNIWHYPNLTAAADFIEGSLAQAGYKVRRQSYEAEGKTCCNLEVEIKGLNLPEQIVIIGAHYDTVAGSPGANDNASAVAAVLALGRRFARKGSARTLRFVLFANEEFPFFQSEQMGSLVYAKACREKSENIIAMLSLETIGYYTEQPNSQTYPFPFSLYYPSIGNFLGFVSDLSSRKLLKKAIASFRKNCKFPCEGGAIPKSVPGIAWSDQWSFWEQRYPAIMLTDTAPFRYPYYHTAEDTTDKLDFDSLARVVTGIESVVKELVTLPNSKARASAFAFAEGGGKDALKK